MRADRYFGKVGMKSRFFGMRYTIDGRKASTSEVKHLIQVNSQAYQLFKKGSSLRTTHTIFSIVGNIMFWGGAGAYGGTEKPVFIASMGAGLLLNIISGAVFVPKAKELIGVSISKYNSGINTYATKRKVSVQLALVPGGISTIIKF